MAKFDTVIIGGGASGLTCACLIEGKVALIERGDRVGRKLSATGNGQGNLTNEGVAPDKYFTSHRRYKVAGILSKHGKDKTLDFFKSLGVMFVTDERGRVYPSSRQASALTDALRYEVARRGVTLVTGEIVTEIKRTVSGFTVVTPNGEYESKAVVVATGGKAAKNFGTDGVGYGIVKKLGHSVTELTPSLVQLKTDTEHTKTLKGIRVHARATLCGREEKGDIIFTDYGVSGDAIFRLSAFYKEGEVLTIDLLPEVESEELTSVLTQKKERGVYPKGELLSGILNNQVGRAVVKRVGGENPEELTKCVKGFTLTVTGTLGFDYAQVTKGGVPLTEVTENLESKKHRNLFFTGEILDVDGECGGYNLQWAFSSAFTVSERINAKIKRN